MSSISYNNLDTLDTLDNFELTLIGFELNCAEFHVGNVKLLRFKILNEAKHVFVLQE